MIASLYQSDVPESISISCLRRARLCEPRDQGGMLGIELDLLAPADPMQTISLEQLIDRIVFKVCDAEPIERQVDDARLWRERIEAYRDEHVVVRDKIVTRIEDDGRIVAWQKFEIEPIYKGDIVAANSVEAREQRLDVVRPIPVPDFIFVLLRVAILFAIGKRAVLAQFEAVINPEEPAKRCREDRPDAEGRRTALLQETRQNIGRVGEEMRAEILPGLVACQMGEIVDQLLLLVAPGEIGV